MKLREIVEFELGKMEFNPFEEQVEVELILSDGKEETYLDVLYNPCWRKDIRLMFSDDELELEQEEMMLFLLTNPEVEDIRNRIKVFVKGHSGSEKSVPLVKVTACEAAEGCYPRKGSRFCFECFDIQSNEWGAGKLTIYEEDALFPHSKMTGISSKYLGYYSQISAQIKEQAKLYLLVR